MRAPGGCGIRRIHGSRGPRLPQRFLPPIPAETGQRYSKRSPLTVLLRPQVQNYSLTKLGLILAGAMASAIQRFRGSSEWGISLEGSMPHPGHRQMKRRNADGNA